MTSHHKPSCPGMIWKTWVQSPTFSKSMSAIMSPRMLIIGFTSIASCSHTSSSLKSGNSSLGVSVQVASLKRKSPHDEGSTSRASSQDTTTSTSSISAQKLEVYNGILQRKAGDIYPIHLTSPRIPRIDATTVPTPEMLAAAKAHLADGVKKARRFVRRQFLDQLLRIPGPPVTFVNDRNKETPSLSFTYIQDYVYGEGVSRTEADAVMLGCTKCRPDMGSDRGCEYTRRCDCLEYATPDFKSQGLSKEEQKAHYEAWRAGELDAAELPKRFPYRLDNDQRTGIKQYVLDGFYLESRNVLYECNPKCKCGPKCKNRLVQKGRTVSLEIFKTQQRGFGKLFFFYSNSFDRC